MSSRISREIRLLKRPIGLPTAADFELAQATIPPPAHGEVLVENLYMSVDPYMRGRMIDRESYVPAFKLGEPLQGGAVGRVIESRNDRFQVGDHVLSMSGWREYFLSPGADLQKVDPATAPLSAYLGVLGMPGFTAWYGLLEIGRPQPGQTVFVSGAAGAVGSAVCQIAKARGCRVIGSAGSDEKVRWLTEEVGVDVAINYKTLGDGSAAVPATGEVDRTASQLRAALQKAAPDGIDIYFDNVGGDHLEAALWGMNPFGRIIACGSISSYNATQAAPGPPNLTLIVVKRLTLQGFIVSDHHDGYPEFATQMAGWIANGTVTWRETVHNGLETAPEAFLALFSGGNLGKMVVKLRT